MRWICFITVFLAIIFCSFWGYLWIYRVEFLTTALERSSFPYKINIDSIEIQGLRTVVLHNLSIHTKENSPKRLSLFSTATFSASPASWFFWLFTPSTAPLHLESAIFHLSQTSPLSFEHPHLHLMLDIDNCSIEQADGTQRTYKALRLPVADLLAATTQPS